MLGQLLPYLENILTMLAMLLRLPQELLAYVRDWLHFRKLANRFPGPPGLPLVGNMFDFGLYPNMMALLKWLTEGEMCRYPAGQIWMGPMRIIVLGDVKDVQVFMKNPKNQSKPKLIEDLLTQTIGQGLITLNGDMWHLHHRIISPSFHQNLLNTYVLVMNRKADVFVNLLSQYVNGPAIDVKPMTVSLALDVICETLMGVPSNQQTEAHNDLLVRIHKYRKELSGRASNPLLYNNWIYNMLKTKKTGKRRNFVRGILQKAVDRRDQILRTEDENLSNGNHKEHSALETTFTSETDKERKSKNRIVIDALLQAKENGFLSQKQVFDELRTILLAGFENLAIILQFALFYLAKHSLIQDKAVKELRDVFEAAGSTEVTPEVLQRLQYVEMIVKETLRLHSPVPITLRVAGIDTALVSSDLIVPAGANVLIAPKRHHMDHKLYPDPHVFDPDRFSPENSSKLHPYAHIPFGAGARSCIGKKYAMMDLKIAIAKTIWNYRVEPDETYEPDLIWGVVMETTNGMRIKLLRRSN